MSYIIAEIGTSHQGDIEKAKKLVDLAYDSGCSAVKFQWVYADEILHPKTGFVDLPGGKIPLYERFKELEVAPSFFEQLLHYAHEKKLDFICSPFGVKSLKELLFIEPDAIKIASPELNHFPMLEYLAEYRKNQMENGQKPIKVILSSGVSTLSDIEKAIEILGKENLILLHCITSYPAPESEYNVQLIQNLSLIFGIPTGVSDHSLDPILVPSLSCAVGGSVLEKHITISNETDGLDDPVALNGEQFSLMVHCVRQTQACVNRYGREKALEMAINQLSESYGREKVLACLGDGVKKLAPCESSNYGRTNRSLHYMKALNEGHIINENDIGVLRTEKVLNPGLSPSFLKKLIGKKLLRNVEDGNGVAFEDFFIQS